MPPWPAATVLSLCVFVDYWLLYVLFNCLLLCCLKHLKHWKRYLVISMGFTSLNEGLIIKNDNIVHKCAVVRTELQQESRPLQIFSLATSTLPYYLLPACGTTFTFRVSFQFMAIFVILLVSWPLSPLPCSPACSASSSCFLIWLSLAVLPSALHNFVSLDLTLDLSPYLLLLHLLALNHQPKLP